MPAKFEITVFRVGVWILVVSVIAIPSIHFGLRMISEISLLDKMKSIPILPTVFLYSFFLSFLLGYYFLLRSIRFLKRQHGKFHGTLLALLLFVTCPIGGFLAFKWRLSESPQAKNAEVLMKKELAD